MGLWANVWEHLNHIRLSKGHWPVALYITIITIIGIVAVVVFVIVMIAGFCVTPISLILYRKKNQPHTHTSNRQYCVRCVYRIGGRCRFLCVRDSHILFFIILFFGLVCLLASVFFRSENHRRNTQCIELSVIIFIGWIWYINVKREKKWIASTNNNNNSSSKLFIIFFSTLMRYTRFYAT